MLFIVLFLGVWIGVFGSDWLASEYKSAKSSYDVCIAALDKSK